MDDSQRYDDNADWTGLAAAILLRAVSDAARPRDYLDDWGNPEGYHEWLRDIGYESALERVADQEVADFFHSDWARLLADATSLEIEAEEIYRRCKGDERLRERVGRLSKRSRQPSRSETQ
jgi:hypothetical protein